MHPSKKKKKKIVLLGSDQQCVQWQDKMSSAIKPNSEFLVV